MLVEQTPLEEYIQDLYVVEDSGVCVYHSSISNDYDKVDDTIVSSFLSAIETFSNNIQSNVNKLTMNDFEFIYHRDNKLLFVARIKNGIDEQGVFNLLKRISSKFFAITDLIQPFTGDISQFKVIGDLLLDELNQTHDLIHRKSIFEISGRRDKISNQLESRIYAILRLKGRITVSQICEFLKKVTQR
jgi:hypothetical protein